MATTNVLYFGGQTANSGPSLRRLFNKAASSPLLRQFLDQSADTLRLEASCVGVDDQQVIPVFRSVSELADQCDGDAAGNNVVLCTIALYVAQLGDYICRVEQDPGLLTSPRRIVGICTGLLPAAVAAISSSISGLITNARDMLLVVVRLALQTRRRSLNIEVTPKSWSVVILGGTNATITDVEDLLDEFHRDHQPVPTVSRVYISAESALSLTVSGPPAFLERFITHPKLSGWKKARLPVFAAFHAPHLPRVDSASLIDSSILLAGSVPENTTLFSCSTGTPYSAITLAELFPHIVADILENRLFDERTIESALRDLGGGLRTTTTVDIFGPAGTNSLRRAAEQVGLDNVDIRTFQSPTSSETASSAGIAIVGMAGRFPGCEDLEGFWDLLRAGKDVHSEVPKDRFDTDLHLDKSGQAKNSTLSAYGCFLDKPGAFDHRLFNMSPREAQQTDPCHRLLLTATYEALETAGYPGANHHENAERVGSFVSLTEDDWREYNTSQDIDMYFVTGGLRAFAAGRLNYFFKWEGPSFTVDTACSSGAAAVQLACASLLDRDCDVAVVGGANVMSGPNLYAGLSRAGFVSPTGSSKAFDETADGYCRGEAAAVLVLKRLDDAVARRDKILGVIRSVTTNHSAHAPSITQPHAPAQQSLYAQALCKAGMKPHDIGYVEAHGTGTQAGDVKEMDSIFSTFAESRTAENPLYVGGVKANVGHGESVAGITSVIKSLLMFRESTIPPHAGIKTRLNRKFPPLEAAHIHVPRVLASFAVPAGPKRVLVSSFGASGGNTCIILEECPLSPDVSNGIKPTVDNRTHHVVAVSAKTQASLDGNRHRLLDYLRSHPGALLRDVAYTTTSRRMHHPLRLAFSVSSIEQLIQQLSQASGDVASRSSSARSKVIMMFPGQGVRLAGSGKVLYRTCSRFKQIISGLEGLCESLGLPSFLHILLSEESEAAAPVGPVATQLAIVALEIALAELLRSWGIIPDAVIGHSLGEYAALCVAGVLSVSDTLFLVGRRAELVEKLCSPGTHGMLAVALSADQCRSLIHEGQGGAAGCVVSCVNGPRSTVISGLHAELDGFQTAMNKEHPGTRSSKVATGYAFHSPQLDSIIEPYLQLASAVRFSSPKVPVASTRFGRLVDGEGDDGGFCASYLVDHARQPVQFDAALRACEAAGLIDGSGILVEAGPDSLCLSMSRAILQKPGELLPCLKSSSSEGSWETVTNLMSRAYARGFPVNWEEYNKPYEQILELLDLPLYQFDQKDFWIPYKGGVAALQREVDQLKLRLEQTSTSSSTVAPEPVVSSCLHSIGRESIAQDKGTILFKTDIQKQPIRDLIEGHNVVGVRLAPSSVYGEMAFSAARHVHSRLYPERKCPAMELRDCAISAPLILTPGTEPQEVDVEVVLEKAKRLATVRISSDKEHARCTVVLLDGDERWARDWSGKHYLIHERVQNLRAASQPAGSVHHIWRDMVYKIFAPVTNYAAAYWSIATVSVQQDFREAAMQLDMRDTPNGHSFSVDPCWLDAIAQAAGFMLNSNPAKPDDILYVSTGWQALRVSRALSPGTGYHCHVRANACSADDATVLCDVTVFDDSDVLAAAEGLIFKRVRKAHLLALFGEPMEKTKPVAPTNFSRMAHGAALINTTPKSNLKEKRSGNPRTNARISALLDVIADEVGVSVSELADDSTLESLGVDSLLTISITSRLKTEMDIDFPAALMLGSTTISELRSSLPGSDTGSPSESEDDEGGRSSAVSQASPDTPLTSTSEISLQDLFDGLVTAVADEARIEPRLMSDDTLLAELGIDSLMSIAVSRTVQRGTGIELPASLLTDCATLGEAKEALRSMYGASEESLNQSPLPMPKLDFSLFHSNAVLLHGDPRSDRPRLFLISEGSGSAATYIHLPKFSAGVTTYGLDSPFLHCPEQFTCSMEEICSIYRRAIQSTQPHGPYLIGGWSIGGMYAYETARQLIAAGERVDGLLLIDSACPRRLEGLPPITVETCEETGMFDGLAKAGGKRPLTLAQKQHVANCVRAATEHEPILLPETGRPTHAFVIWSRFGMFEKLSLKVKEVGERIAEERGVEKTGVNQDWLTGERTSFGPKGWDLLLGPVECFVLDGDHFSIMMLPKIKTHTGPLLQQLVQRFVDARQHPGSLSGTALSYPLIRGKFDNVQTLRAIFDKEEGCENFMTRIYPQQRRLVIAYIAEAFDKLGCRLQDLAVGSPVVVRGVLPKHAQVLDALYEILEDSGLVERDNGGRATRSHRPVELTPSVTLHEEIIRVSPQHKGTHELLQVTASQLADCLTGEVNPMHLVFGLNRSLIQDFYTHAPMFASASRHLGEFLKQTYAAALIAETERRPFELLEVGAGMGGTTKHVLDMLVHAGIPFRYTYTDISPSLVAAAKKRFTSESGGRGELANRMEFAVLDVTEAAIPERLLGRFHTVLSSNCVHATPDLALSTEHMRRMLRPNGFIALVELTTPRLYWLDLVFGFFDGWWSFADGRRHALAGMGFWETSLRKAGFGDVLWLDETKIGDTLNPQLVVAFNNGSG